MIFRGLIKRITYGTLALAMGFSVYVGSPADPVYVYADTTVNDNDNKEAGISGEEIVALAASYVGKLPYGGGKSLETSVDCAWFAGRIFEKFGIDIYATSYRYGYGTLSGYLFYQGRDIGTFVGTDPKLAQAGDLIVTTGHVAIATGKGTAISALMQGVREHPVQDGDPYHYFGGYNGEYRIYRPFKVKANAVYNDPINGIYQGVDYSAVYNYKYYSTRYTDLAGYYGFVENAKDQSEATSIAELYIKHFINHGMREGRQGCEDFNVKIYRRNYADLRGYWDRDYVKYFVHYMNHGKKENRNGRKILNPVTVYNGVDYKDIYDFNYYVNKYPDMKNYYSDDDEAALKHFVEHGMAEGRQGNESFELTSYKYLYSDLRTHFGNDNKKYYIHYMNYGKKEGRTSTGVTKMVNYQTLYTYNGETLNFSKVYDFNYYINKYPDMKKYYQNDDAGALKHFVEHGIREGRQGSENFNLQVYRSNSPDLMRLWGVDKSNNYLYYRHYMIHGYRENRKSH